MPLDLSAARLAIGRIAQRLGVSEIDAAEGIVDNADAAMVSALHLVSTRRGRDPANFALVAFGGAGPLHAGAAGRQLGAARILIPPHPGTASAYGLLLADLRHELSRTLLQPFGALDYEGIGTILHQLAERGRHALSRDGVPPNATSLLPSLDVRYVGQSFELRIPLTGLELDASAEATAAAHFHAEHHRAYGYAAPDEPIELVNLRLSAIGRRGKPRLPTIDNHVGSIDSALRRSRPVYFDGAWMECPVYIRDRLGAGAVVLGPAVLEEFDSTTIIHPGQTARVDVSGNVLIDPSSGP
jgi:N-methylhydantoinase A